MPVSTQIQMRRGTASAWTTANPTLASGELGLESDTHRFKFGDGTTAWATLPYAGGGLAQSDYDVLLPWTIEKTPVAVWDPALKVGSWSLATEAADLFGFPFVNNVPTQNDEIGWDLMMAAGTWNFNMTYLKFSGGTIITVNLDGVAVGTVDSYNSVTLNNQQATITGIACPSNGKHRLSLKAATKNASSTAFEMIVCGFQLRRTA